jgi:hypothetical protein
MWLPYTNLVELFTFCGIYSAHISMLKGLKMTKADLADLIHEKLPCQKKEADDLVDLP